jgi:hypothetical protein
MPINGREMAQTLRGKLQFVESQSRHRRFERECNGNTVTTYMSHGADEIGDTLISQMARQVLLTPPQLKEAVVCTLSADDYTALLAQHFAVGEGSASTGGALRDDDEVWKVFEQAQLLFWDDPETYGPALEKAKEALHRKGYTTEDIWRVAGKLATRNNQ